MGTQQVEFFNLCHIYGQWCLFIPMHCCHEVASIYKWQMFDIPVVVTPLLLYCLVALAGGGIQLGRSLTAAEIWARIDVQLFILRQ
jgi:hypothetical protein